MDLGALEEGNTITVKWRGKPVFIKYRTEEEIASANAVALTDLKDPQKDAERVVDPKVRHLSTSVRHVPHTCTACNMLHGLIALYPVVLLPGKFGFWTLCFAFPSC